MANPLPIDVEESEEVYLDDGEANEVIVNEDAGEPMSEDEDGPEDAGEGCAVGENVASEGAAAEEDSVVFVDDSVQGFFDHREPVYAVDIHPTQQHVVATGGGDDKAYLWRLDSGQKMYELQAHTDSVIDVAFSYDGMYVASGGMDGKIHVAKALSGQHVITLEGPSEVVWIRWHPRGAVLLAGSSDGTIWMWKIPEGNCMNVFSNHTDTVTCGQFTPNGKGIVSGSEDGSFIIWDPKTAVATWRVDGSDGRFHNGPITTLAVNKDSSLALTGSQDGTAKLIHLGNPRILGSFENHTESVEAVDFSPTVAWAATGSVDGSLNIWDLTTLRLRHTCRHDDAVTRIKFHESSPLLTSVSVDRTVRLWDTRTGNSEKIWKGHQDSILDFAQTHDGSIVVTGGDDGVALVFSV
ncbi:hypothetical protein HK102_010973 [Quaeritorhiza haematococci]|nr:hypothetical protein HK102_010973 [Quaeritorhiza haematococci]